jgi:hypothetical protein
MDEIKITVRANGKTIAAVAERLAFDDNIDNIIGRAGAQVIRNLQARRLMVGATLDEEAVDRLVTRRKS